MNSVSGALIGSILGFIASFGYMAMNVKKNQRLDLFPIIATITTIFGAVSGGRIGYKLERSDKIDKSLGFHDVKHSHFKVGRFWESKSTWNDVKGMQHSIRTFKSTNRTVSYFDGTLFINHGTSASSVNVGKYHNDARNQAFDELRKAIGDRYIKDLSKA